MTMTEFYLLTTVDYDGEGDPTAVLCTGVEPVAQAHRALWKKLRKSGEDRTVAVYAFDPFSGKTTKLDVEEVGEPVQCKDGSLDQQYRLVDSQELTLHVYNARIGDADLERAQEGKAAPSNAATPGTSAYIPTGDNRE